MLAAKPAQSALHSSRHDGLPQASIKSSPADFCVRENLGFDFDGTGEHVYFQVCKTGHNTADVAKALAAACDVRVLDVGYAGLKDKHAVTTQWFSVPSKTDEWPLEQNDFQCLRAARHSRKLRRGMHAGNYFELRLTNVERIDEVEAGLRALSEGFANYFGRQRVSADNVEQAKRWLAKRAANATLPKARGRRHGKGRKGGKRPSDNSGWQMSVLRSLLFNEVLNARCVDGSWATPIDGDVLIDETPSAPLWGRGWSATQGVAASIEEKALADFEDVRHGLEFSGLQQDRRIMCVRPDQLKVERAGDNSIAVSFGLPPGAYATELLAGVCETVDLRGGQGPVND